MQRLYNGAERPNRCVYCYIIPLFRPFCAGAFGDITFC